MHFTAAAGTIVTALQGVNGTLLDRGVLFVNKAKCVPTVACFQRLEIDVEHMDHLGDGLALVECFSELGSAGKTLCEVGDHLLHSTCSNVLSIDALGSLCQVAE